MICGVSMGETWDKLKSNPVFLIAIFLTIIGIVIAIYGKYKSKKYIMYSGIGLTAGAAFTAIGSWAYSEYGGGGDNGEETTGFTGYGAAGAPLGLDVTTPE